MEIIKKESSNLAGEIFYYLNIPSKVKDMFPVITNFDDNNTWYEIEKINGLTLSVLYVSGLLNMITLKSVMDSIRRLQSCKCDVNSDINIYENYSKKLEKRYQSYDYSSFENHEYIFNDINNNLKEYEKLKKGTLRVIHGDAVLTNIIVNEYQKIKFIDMRGKLGNKLSIYGDWLYDWAKLYQSLVGYDYILLNKNINSTFQKKIVDYFTDYFITLYSENDFINLKMITKSMLFSLIPLHDNENCLKFYNLIKCKFLN
jgi:aminoglycoside phosphotransferase